MVSKDMDPSARHLLFSQRTRVWFPAPTLQPSTAPVLRVLITDLLGHHVHTWCSDAHAGKTLRHIA